MQQRRHRRGRGAFDHQLGVRHHPHHGVEHIGVRQRHDVVDELADNGVRIFTHTLDAQSVDDGVDSIERDDSAGFDALLHAGRARRFDADDFDPRVRRLERHRHARDEPASADRHDDDVGLWKVFMDLEAERSLARDELRIVERMNICESALDDELPGFLVGLVPDRAVQHHFRSVRARRVDLGRRRILGHDDDGVHAIQPGGERHALCVVAGRGADDAAPFLLVGQVREFVERSTNLVRAGFLEHLGLEPNVEAGALAEDARGDERRLVDVGRDDRTRTLEVSAREWGHRPSAGRPSSAARGCRTAFRTSCR